MQKYAAFVATKRDLARALHSGDPAFDTLSGHFDQRLRPALRTLLANATAADVIRTDIDAAALLSAVAKLCMSARNAGPGQAKRRAALLVDTIRCVTMGESNLQGDVLMPMKFQQLSSCYRW